MKKMYEMPFASIQLLEAEDVIVTSTPVTFNNAFNGDADEYDFNGLFG